MLRDESHISLSITNHMSRDPFYLLLFIYLFIYLFILVVSIAAIFESWKVGI